MDDSVINSVRSSYGRCIKSGTFFDDFYNTFLNKSSEVKEKFKNTEMTKQKDVLQVGVAMLILYVKGTHTGQRKINDLANSHSRKNMNISPKLYPLWKDSLIETIAKYDKELNFELRKNWETVLQKGIDGIVSGYDN